MDKFWKFFFARFGTVTQCSVEPTVSKCAHKIPKFIKNSAKVHQTPLLMKNSYKNAMHKLFDKKSAWPMADYFCPLKSAADTDTDCWKKSVSAKIILHRYVPDVK